MSQLLAWKCEVCGYVHSGAEPPAVCPICGVAGERFAPLTVTVAVSAVGSGTGTGSWRCTICDHCEPGADPPGRCPLCGAGANLFEPAAPPEQRNQTEVPGPLLILGAGIAGMTAAEQARGAAPTMAIRLISAEPDAPYYRLNLTRLLAAEVSPESLTMQPPAWFADNRIELVAGEVASIARDQKQVLLQDGRRLDYGRLLLACGAHPFVPPFPGATRQGVATLRTLADARILLRRVQPNLRCVCIGGGLLGLETAAALRRRGAQVTVLEGHGWLLPRQLPRGGGELLREQVEAQGIGVSCGVAVAELLGDERVRGVLLSDGREFPADLVLVTSGVRPNSYLARQAGLKVAGGVLVDDRMTTSDPVIFAAGDVAEHRGVLYGIWPAAFAQGVVAGINAVGGSAEFTGLPPACRLKVLEVELFSIGRLSGDDASFRFFEVREGGRYRALLCRDSQLVGAALVGDVALAAVVREAVDSGAPLLERPALLEHFPGLAAALS